MKISNLSGVTDSSDDSVIMLSYTTDGGTTYQSKKIRLADLIDDFEVGDLADVSAASPGNGEVLAWNSTNSAWEPSTAGGTGATNLSYTSSTRVIASSTGDDATLPEVVASGDSGLMTGADKAKLDGIAAGAEVNVNADWDAVSGDAQILNKPTIPVNIDDLGDVDTSSSAPNEMDVLSWDGVNWVPTIPHVRVSVHNATGSTISKGTPVYVSGTHASGKPTVEAADSDGAGTYPAIGLVEADIATLSDGVVIISGSLENLDTSGYSAGDALYLSTTAGVLTSTRPTASSTKVQKVALVSKSHASSGSVIVMGAGRTNDVNNELTALTGVGLNETTLGTFTGATITDSSSIKTALQELETAIESTTGTANLGYTAAPTGGTVTSDTGSDATLTLADGTNAGLLAPADFTKLSGIATGAEVNVQSDWNAVSGDALILNKPTLVAAIDDLSDVDTSTVAPTDGQALVWDNTASKWEPGTISGGGGGSVPSTYSGRPALHRGSLFSKPTDTTLELTAGCFLNGHEYTAATSVTMPTFTNNTDYAIWQHPSTGALVADASFTTAPTGATGGDIVGGFHYVPSGRPTGYDNASPTTSAEILEYSIWDLTYRPDCPDPRGMVCIDGRFWVDIYLLGELAYASDDFSNTYNHSSKISVSIADGGDPPLKARGYGGDGITAYTTVNSNGAASWFNFTEIASSFGKRLLGPDEFSVMAYGVDELTARGTDPVTTKWERCSVWGVAQAAGCMDTLCGHRVMSGTASFTTVNSNETGGRGTQWSRGAAGLTIFAMGGYWGSGAGAGSRRAAMDRTPQRSENYQGTRLAANHRQLG